MLHSVLPLGFVADTGDDSYPYLALSVPKHAEVSYLRHWPLSAQGLSVSPGAWAAGITGELMPLELEKNYPDPFVLQWVNSEVSQYRLPESL